MKNKDIDIKNYSKNFPNSKKVYIEGSQKNIQVPMRMIEQTTTKLDNFIKINEPIYVYDTTGSYTDTDYNIDIEKGLNLTRKEWIDARFVNVIFQKTLNLKQTSLV